MRRQVAKAISDPVLLDRFISERCVFDPLAEENALQFWCDFRAFCRDADAPIPDNRSDFTRTLRARGIRRCVLPPGVWGYRGIALLGKRLPAQDEGIIRVGPAKLPINVSDSDVIGKKRIAWSWPAALELSVTGVATSFLYNKWFNAVRLDESWPKGVELSCFCSPSRSHFEVSRSVAPRFRALLKEVLNWPESWQSYADADPVA